jgi:hypothetical protein
MELLNSSSIFGPVFSAEAQTADSRRKIAAEPVAEPPQPPPPAAPPPIPGYGQATSSLGGGEGGDWQFFPVVTF